MKSIKIKILIAFLSALVTVAALVLVLEIVNTNRLILGLKIADLYLGGQKIPAAEKILEQKINELLAKKISLTLVINNKNWSVDIAETGLVIDKTKNIATAYQLGHSQNFLTSLSEQLLSLFGKYNLSLQIEFDQTKFDQFTNTSFAAVENKAKQVSLAYNPAIERFEIVSGQEGQIIDRQKLQNDLSDSLSSAQSTPVNLILVKDTPKTSPAQAAEALNKSKIILINTPYNLVFEDQTWPLKREMIIDWLKFNIQDSGQVGFEFNQEEVNQFLVNLAPKINQPAVNAVLGSDENDNTIIIAPAQDQIALDTKETFSKIVGEILNSPADQLLRKINIQVATKNIPAPIRTETLNELGLLHRLGTGQSDFSGSSYNRKQNITVGTSKISGTLLSPQEEFHFNETLGEVRATDGYLPELVIKNKKLVPEYGGGLCQVSTTLFRAAIFSGFQITERYPHAFPVRYYNPQGFDATIYPPHPDLRFINDTQNNIYIQGYTSSTKAYFEVYGTKDGRDVQVKGPVIYESNPDGSMKTVLTQEVYQDEKLIRQDKFYSNYKSPSLYPVEKNPLE